jgi:DNA-binding CsgD family transcriptional regulator
MLGMETGSRDWEGLLLDLYAGVADPDRMGRFIEGLAHGIGCHSAALTRRDFSSRSGNAMIAVGAMNDVANVARYEGEFVATRENLWFERARPHVRTGAVVIGEEWATSAEIKRGRYYADFLREIDTLYSAGLCGLMQPLRTVMLTFCRPERAGSFEDGELDLLRALAPHWVNACSLSTQLEQARTLVDEAQPALFGLDTHMQLSWCNNSGESMLGGGLWSGRKRGLVTPTHAASRALWSKALRVVASGACNEAAPVPLYRRDGMLSAFAVIRPYGVFAAEEQLPRYLVTIRLLAQQSDDRLCKALVVMFDLTAGEAALAQQLHVDGDLGDAAAALGIGTPTARTRLQSIYGKTGLHRQRELQRMLDALNDMVGSAPRMT